MAKAEKNLVKVLTEVRMREHFGRDLERLRESGHYAEAMRQYEAMYRKESKRIAKALRPVLAEVWEDGWKALANWECMCWNKCTCKPENPYEATPEEG